MNKNNTTKTKKIKIDNVYETRNSLFNEQYDISLKEIIENQNNEITRLTKKINLLEKYLKIEVVKVESNSLRDESYRQENWLRKKLLNY